MNLVVTNLLFFFSFIWKCLYLRSWRTFLLYIKFWVVTFFFLHSLKLLFCLLSSFLLKTLWLFKSFPYMYCAVFPDFFKDFLSFWFSAVGLWCIDTCFPSKLSCLRHAELLYVNLQMCFTEFGKFLAVISKIFSCPIFFPLLGV